MKIKFHILSLLFCLSFIGYAQTGIGAYSAVDGGFENHTTTLAGGSSGSLVLSTSLWTANTTGNSVRTLSTNAGRTGPKYISLGATNGTIKNFFSPQMLGKFAPNTTYQIQFWYKSSSTAALDGSTVDLYVDNNSTTAAGTKQSVAAGLSTNKASWTKVAVAITTNGTPASTNGIVGLSIDAASAGYSADFDDFVVYQSDTPDSDLPLSPGAISATSPAIGDANLSWVAASDVDGGGYVVVRYATTAPSASDDPIQNGIYAKGNAIGAGEVRYIGSATSFSDTGLSLGVDYYYKVYTVDKAFNYSDESVTNSVVRSLAFNTNGSFVYTPTGLLSSKPITVYYHIPSGDRSTMPILFSFHGEERNASDYRDYWISMANANGFMVFAPEFSVVDFPSGDGYQMGNVFVNGDSPSLATLNPTNQWTFSIIDPLFESIKSTVSGTQQTYDAWGHSAGAQFLQRYRFYLPNSKMKTSICSNAGWYTVPESTIDFPYGINKGQLSNSDITISFSKKLIVHLGLDDIDPNSSGLRHNTTVDNQQGLNRLERGRYFFTKSQSISKTLNAPFNWEKQEVAGVGHEGQLMANDALKYLKLSFLSINNGFQEQLGEKFSATAYPNPSDKDFTLKVSNDNFGYKVYDSLGKLVEQQEVKQTQTAKIGSAYAAGIYHIIVTQDKQIRALKLIKK